MARACLDLERKSDRHIQPGEPGIKVNATKHGALRRDPRRFLFVAEPMDSVDHLESGFTVHNPASLV